MEEKVTLDVAAAELVDDDTPDAWTPNPSSAIEVRPQAPVNLFGADDPATVIEKAAAHASALADVVRQRNLVVKLGSGEHVQVEGWTLLGSMLGVFPVAEWTRELRDEHGRLEGWEARVSAQTLDGRVVGAAEAECRFSERNWAKRDSYALRSMAQTRATSKALRMPLGFVMQLAGFNPTPAEEMPVEVPSAQGSAGYVPARDGERRASASRPITDAQKGKIHALLAEHGIADLEYREILAGKFGVESSRGLSRAQASELIEALSDPVKRANAVGWARERLAEQAGDSA